MQPGVIGAAAATAGSPCARRRKAFCLCKTGTTGSAAAGVNGTTAGWKPDDGIIDISTLPLILGVCVALFRVNGTAAAAAHWTLDIGTTAAAAGSPGVNGTAALVGGTTAAAAE